MDYLLIQGYATSLFLHCVRVGGFFAVLPLFGNQSESMGLRMILSTALGAIFWWVGEQRIDAPEHLLELGVMAIREGIVGIALAFALSTMTSLLVSAGEFISHEMGFSMARTINPESGVQGTVISQFLQTLGFLLILQLNIHHDCLRVVELTFETCRVGRVFDILPIWDGIVTLVSGSVQIALQYSFPILGVMLLISAGLVLLSRAVPAINLMEFAFALRIVISLSAFALFLTDSAPFLIETFHSIVERAAQMFGG